MTDEAMSPSRRRMIEDMTIRKFAPKTQHDYVQRVILLLVGPTPLPPEVFTCLASINAPAR